MSKSNITYQQLIAFAAGELSPQGSAQVKEYVSRSPAAAATVASYQAVRRCVAEDDSVAPSAGAVALARAIFRSEAASAGLDWLDRVAATVARLIFDSRLQPVGVRYAGTGRRIQLTFETDDLEVDLQAEPVSPADRDDSRPRWRLMGQINPAADSQDIAVAAVRHRAAGAMAQTRTDDRGWFVLEVPPGRYDLCLELPDGPVVLPDLELV